MGSHSGERTLPGESSFCHPDVHEAFDLDVLLRALANPCRREVLCLLDVDPVWEFEDLAANLGTVETVPRTASRSEREAVLFHNHLPLLAEAGLIESDRAYRLIRRGEHFEDVREMVDAAVSALP